MKLQMNSQGLIPAIAQDEKTGEVLMVAYMSPESIRRTVESHEAWFFSRSRNTLWKKGETSGNVIAVNKIEVDCDADTILLKCSPSGPVCHTGNRTCFYQDLDPRDLEFEVPDANVMAELFEVIESRKHSPPEGSYVGKLLSEGMDRIARKVIEEAGETVIAAKNDVPAETIHEVADLWFHSLILLAKAGLTPDDIYKELAGRRNAPRR